MRITRRDSILSILAAVGAPALAQEFPTRSLTIVVPFAPGGSTDVAARAVAERMSKTLGQTVIIDNKAGAAGQIGAEFVARAAPDGHVMGAVGASTGVHPFVIGPTPRYKMDDFVYIGQLAYVELVLLARKSLEVTSVKDVIELARSRPGKLTVGDSGTAVELAMELFKTATKTSMVRVPYKGDAPALADVVGGHADLAMITVASATGQIKAGTVKAIGVASRARSRGLPEVPTLAEGGVTGYEAGVPTMMAVPRDTPRAVQEKLNAALNDALSDPALVERFTSLGLGIQRYTLAEAQAAIRGEYDKIVRLVKEANLPTTR